MISDSGSKKYNLSEEAGMGGRGDKHPKEDREHSLKHAG